ncbi:hypothetical protein [Sphingomonas sp. UYP23]
MSHEDESAYIAKAQDPKTTASDLMNFAHERGFAVTPQDAQSFIAKRGAKGALVGNSVAYKAAQGLPTPPPSASRPADATPSLGRSAASAAASFADGALPNASRFLAGAGGAAGNAVRSATGGEEFDPGLYYQSAANGVTDAKEELQRDHPGIADAAGWGGFGASMFAPGATVARDESLGAHMANGAVTSGGYGAVSGAMNDTGDGNVTNAVNGLGMGLTAGALAAPAFRGAAAAMGSAQNRVPGVDATARFLQNLPRHALKQPLIAPEARANAQAERMIAGQMRGGDIDAGMGAPGLPTTAENVAAEVAARQARGVPAMPGDVSEDLRHTTAWALQGRGPMATRAREALGARQAQMGQRVRAHVTDELGPAVDPIAAVADIQRNASAAARPGYTAAYAQPMVVTDQIARTMRTPAFRDALPQAVRNIRNNPNAAHGGDPEALGFRMGDDGSLDATHALSTEGFDQVVRAMNDSRTAAMDSSGMFPRDTTNSVHIGNLARGLRSGIGEHNEAYRDTVARYGDEMGIKDGMELGGKVASQTGPEINAYMTGNGNNPMSGPAREAYSVGARTALADTATQAGLQPAANATRPVRQALGLSGAGSLAAPGDAVKQQAVETMSGRPGVMNRLDDRLEGEDQAHETFKAAVSAAKPEQRAQLNAAQVGHALQTAHHVATGNVAGFVTGILMGGGNKPGLLRFKRDVQERIAEVMTATQPADVQGLLAAVEQRARTDQQFRTRLSRAGISVAKIQAIHAAGQDTAPMNFQREDGRVLLGEHEGEPVYGDLGVHYPPSH